MANKMDLVDRVHTTIGGTKADAERAVDCAVEVRDAITTRLESSR